MSDPTLNYVQCPDTHGGHRMAYWMWGSANAARSIVCVHGLSRQGRDFDVLAQALVQRSAGAVRVVCPDVVGRGRSDFLSDPDGYQIPTYASDMLALVQHLQLKEFDWVGTSMGGLIGIAVCAHAASLGMKVGRLVLNDVGPVIQWQAIARIGQYLGRVAYFDNVEQAAQAMWLVSTSFGPHTPEQWLKLSRNMVRPATDGSARVQLHYDPAIAVPFSQVTEASATAGEALLWQMYDAITARTLLVRGADSDLLSQETALAMTQRGPRAELLEFAGVGHAPTLVAPDQVDAVARFLL